MSHPELPPAPPPPAPEQRWAATSGSPRTGPPRRLAVLVAGIPVALAVVLMVIAPGFMEPLFDERISVVGVPLGLMLLAAVFALSAVGILVVWVARSWLALVLVVVGLVAPALLLLLLAPAVVLIVTNLRV